MPTRKKRKEKGCEGCPHTCRLSPRHHPVSVFGKEGSSCTRHARSRTCHPNCDSSCPANWDLPTHVSTRPPTVEEAKAWNDAHPESESESEDDANTMPPGSSLAAPQPRLMCPSPVAPTNPQYVVPSGGLPPGPLVLQPGAYPPPRNPYHQQSCPPSLHPSVANHHPTGTSFPSSIHKCMSSLRCRITNGVSSTPLGFPPIHYIEVGGIIL